MCMLSSYVFGIIGFNHTNPLFEDCGAKENEKQLDYDC